MKLVNEPEKAVNHQEAPRVSSIGGVIGLSVLLLEGEPRADQGGV